MHRTGWVGPALWLFLLGLALLAHPAHAQMEDECANRDWGGSDREHACVVREMRMPASGSLEVDGGLNGGVQVEGWDRSEVLVRARVEAWADTRAEAEDVVNAVRIETGRSRVNATGPDGRRQGWSVSYHIFVPRRTNLSLETHNGGIQIENVKGQMRMEALNGGIRLARVAGDVRGSTTNGGLHIDLDGQRWDGAGLDVRTTNGGVRLMVPSNFAAHIETGTVNGGMDVDFPVTVQGRIGGSLSFDVNGGGPTIRAVTTNGGVKILRAGG